jgi:lipopolysaccharide transport system ATP-binding protein
MATTAIETRELGKRYTLGVSGRGYGTLREAIIAKFRNPLPRGRREGADSNQLWALRDLSLTIEPGEVVGLVGHNGAGKSTLLKILSRITEPSSGYAEVTGRVGSLLEVGTGFHPELTGRENIFLNGAILGMRRAEIRARFDEIVAFAEIDRFLDTPVKRYSSGMSVRLAFAVAAHLEPEILLVDEVLAVGDAAFQRKSLAKMSEVAQAGRTVLFVSHNLAIIQALCKRGVLLERGRVQADGAVNEILDNYLAGLERASAADLVEREDRDGRGWQHTVLKKVEMVDASSGQRNAVVGGRSARLVVEVTELLPGLECRVVIANSFGQPVAVLDSEVSAPADSRDPGLGPRLECEIPVVPLLPGRYRLDVGLKANSVPQDGLQAAAFFDVEPGVLEGRPMAGEGVEGSFAFPHSWRLPP